MPEPKFAPEATAQKIAALSADLESLPHNNYSTRNRILGTVQGLQNLATGTEDLETKDLVIKRLGRYLLLEHVDENILSATATKGEVARAMGVIAEEAKDPSLEIEVIKTLGQALKLSTLDSVPANESPHLIYIKTLGRFLTSPDDGLRLPANNILKEYSLRKDQHFGYRGGAVDPVAQQEAKNLLSLTTSPETLPARV